MPSLQALEEFKASFSNLGGELQVLQELELPTDDLSLPDHEPANLPDPFLSVGDIPPDYSDSDESDDSGYMDFNNFEDLMGGIDSDYPSEPDDSDEPDDLDQEDISDNFDIPTGLTDGLADELEATSDLSEDIYDEPLETGTTEIISDDDFSLDDISLDITDDFTENLTDDAQDLDDISLDGLADSDFPDISESPDIPDIEESFEPDLSDASLADIDLSDTGLSDASLSDTDLPDTDMADFDLSEFDSGGTDETAGEPELSGDDDDFFDGEPTASEASREGIAEDSFDDFDFDSPAASSQNGDDDLDLPDIQGFMDTASQEAARAREEGKSEINLTDEEFEKFLSTLASYPLNLRIACKEIIAEKVVTFDSLSQLINLLANGASAREAAALASRILGRTISVPKSYEKQTGEALEAEQSSFAYIFVHNFLPVLRLFLGVALLVSSLGYLYWQFIYTPMRADRIYSLGIEQIQAGQFARANERFEEAYRIRPVKSWFYEYARAFRDARQYNLAEEKYLQLLYFTASRNRRYIPEKEAVLEYADMLTYYMGNFEEADRVIRRNLLDYFPRDTDALLALGDNNMAWGEYDPSRYEDAREAYAILIEMQGQIDPLMERMLMYFIRTDNLEWVLYMQSHFTEVPNRRLSAVTLAEMGGYFLDKRMETVRGVPNEFLGSISGIREILLQAIRQDHMLPEAYYHLARYYNYYNNRQDEEYILDVAVHVFDAVHEGNARRIRYHIDTLQRYSEILVHRREFFQAEDYLVRAVRLFENGISRRLFRSSLEFGGKVYAGLGDLEYFVKDGNMESALRYYGLAEDYGYAPPEILYRMGAAHYQMREWGTAQDYLMRASRDVEQNRRILYALGNVSYMRGNYSIAQSYYDRLIAILEADRSRLPPIQPTDNVIELDLAERLMVAQNNLGVTLETLTDQTGNNQHRFRAHGLYADSQRAWDIITRNPETMIRMRPSPDINAPSVNPPFLNIQNSLRPVPGFEHLFFLRIDMDMLEPSDWEEIAPPGYNLSQGIHTGR